MKIVAPTLLLAMASKSVRVGVGVIVKDPVTPIHLFTNDILKSENKHHVKIFMIGDFSNIDVRFRNLEHHKCNGRLGYPERNCIGKE